MRDHMGLKVPCPPNADTPGLGVCTSETELDQNCRRCKLTKALGLGVGPLVWPIERELGGSG